MTTDRLFLINYLFGYLKKKILTTEGKPRDFYRQAVDKAD